MCLISIERCFFRDQGCLQTCSSGVKARWNAKLHVRTLNLRLYHTESEQVELLGPTSGSRSPLRHRESSSPMKLRQWSTSAEKRAGKLECPGG
jgi:hypothetical protein